MEKTLHKVIKTGKRNQQSQDFNLSSKGFKIDNKAVKEDKLNTM
ncbi:hypothetical protein ABEG63_18115 [Chryseobacterium sp. C39-AII1]